MAIQGLEFDKPTLVDGGHEQKAIVNTASGKQPVNAPTVEDIKRIAKGEAEESSATEWEKSVKDHINYNAAAVTVNFDTNVNVDGDLQCTQKVITTEGIVADTIYGSDDTSVDQTDLVNGNRVFRHELIIEIEIEEDDYYLSFGITNSSPEEIDTGRKLEYNYASCHYASAKLYNSNSDDTVIVLIEDAEEITVSMWYADGTYHSGSVIAVEDIVTQC